MAENSPTRRDFVWRIRATVIIGAAIVCTALLVAKAPNHQTITAALLGSLLSVVMFVEPIIARILDRFVRTMRITTREEIYDAVAQQLRDADSVIRFKTPTTTWGQYSEGLRIFERALATIRDASERGVEVRIIADIWDWERAKFAAALIEAGADVRYKETKHDYYLVTDNKRLLTMGTEDRAHYIKSIDRRVKQLTDDALISQDSTLVVKAMRRFDDEWQSLRPNSALNRIKDLLSDACPHCGQPVHLEFRDQRALIRKGAWAYPHSSDDQPSFPWVPSKSA